MKSLSDPSMLALSELMLHVILVNQEVPGFFFLEEILLEDV